MQQLCIFAGRVTEHYDNRLLTLTLEKFFSEDALKEGHLYSTSGIYYCPQYETVKEFQNYVNDLPLETSCDLFGFNDNADIVNKASNVVTYVAKI